MSDTGRYTKVKWGNAVHYYRMKHLRSTDSRGEMEMNEERKEEVRMRRGDYEHN